MAAITRSKKPYERRGSEARLAFRTYYSVSLWQACVTRPPSAAGVAHACHKDTT
jgi:hypothetical protein